MTGFGGSTVRESGFVITSEIKTVNNRYFKAAFRISDGFSSLETDSEALLRGRIDRGTINVSIRIRPETAVKPLRIDSVALTEYLAAARLAAQSSPGVGSSIPLGSVADYFRLPGVLQEDTEVGDEAQRVWPTVEKSLKQSLDTLDEMRIREGNAMEKNLRDLCAQLAESIDEIERLAPTVVESYREKLTERIASALAEKNLPLDPADLVREVALFTDKADISEETVRFRSHLAQFDAAMKMKTPCGKRLDFLTQEMFRETNTIGSKANNASMTNIVIDMKTVIERVREMVQNVE